MIKRIKDSKIDLVVIQFVNANTLTITIYLLFVGSFRTLFILFSDSDVAEAKIIEKL